MSKGISIITNFGCNRHCSYCIWKTHSLKDYMGPFNLPAITAFLTKFQHLAKVSISGGGDPLNPLQSVYSPVNIKAWTGWWDHVMEVTHLLNMKLDLHTRAKIYNKDWIKWESFNRVSFSSDVLDYDVPFLESLVKKTKVRIVHVVTSQTTIQTVIDYASFAQKHNCQLTFKEPVMYDDNGRYQSLKDYFKGLQIAYFLDAGDYNTYLMPNGLVYDKFLF